jgi:hypothetical protein
MYKITYTKFNQTGGVNKLKPYRDFDGIQNEKFTYNGVSFGQTADTNKFTSVEKTVKALKYILLKYRITLNPINDFDLVDILKDIKAQDDIPIETPGTADANYGNYKDKSLQELFNINTFVNNADRRKWIKAVLNINRIYLEKLDAAAAAAQIPVPSAVTNPPSLTDKNDELNDLQKEYVRAYMVALNEVSKLNNNAIMTPQLRDFFHKSGFEVNPMGYDLMKTRPSQTFSEVDLSLLLNIGGYKLKSNSGSPVYSRF